LADDGYPEYNKYKKFRELIRTTGIKFKKQQRKAKEKNFGRVNNAAGSRFWTQAKSNDDTESDRTRAASSSSYRGRGESSASGGSSMFKRGGSSRKSIKFNLKENINDARPAIYIFDFNTVEMVLLMCAIIVSLAGMMFSSQRFDDRPDLVAQRDAVTIIALLIIVFSLIYYFVVFLSELAPKTTYACLRPLLDTANYENKQEKIRTNSITLTGNPLLQQDDTETFGNGTKQIDKYMNATHTQIEDAQKENESLKAKLEAKKREAEKVAGIATEVSTLNSVNPMMMAPQSDSESEDED